MSPSSTEVSLATHTVSASGVFALKSSHPGVRALKREGYVPSIHGNKVWRSSFVLMDYFSTYPLNINETVLDVGCGWGLTGIFLNKMQHCQVTGVDADTSVAPFLALQAEINGAAMGFTGKRFEQLTKAYLSQFDTVIGADICFWDEMTKSLFNLVRRAMQAGVKQVVIADPGRAPFIELADMCASYYDAEIIVRSIYEPVKSTKHILVVNNDA